MTSISPPVISPQAPNNASQVVASAHSPSASQSGRAPQQAAGTASASAKTSYANATKKTYAASGNLNTAAGGHNQHGQPDTDSPVNGKVAIPHAIPQVGALTIVNGNTPTNPTSGRDAHSRNASVTMNVPGAPYAPNGASVPGKSAGIGIQFGANSPGVANATLQPAQSSNSLAVNSPGNPRLISPQTSPSPIPQPPASGGRPPSNLHGQSNSLSFGALGGADMNVSPQTRQLLPPLLMLQLPQSRSGGMPQGPLAPAPQVSHLRRESSQSQHSDFGGSSVGSNPSRGGYPQQGGRGRGYGPQYQPQASYSPGPNYRQPSNQPRNGQNATPYQQPNRQLQPYPNSPHQAARSPAPQHSQLVHQQPSPMPMQGPHPGQPQYGGYPPPYGYPPNMGASQVKPPSSYASSRRSPKRGQNPRRVSVAVSSKAPPSPLDFSPNSGNFEQFLTTREQYGMSPHSDPNFAAQYYHYYGVFPTQNMGQNMGPPSPRPQMPPGPPTPFQGQYGPQQPPSMSRTSSAISGSDRPASSLGKQPIPNTASATTANPMASRQSNTPAPKTNNFQIPVKKSIGIVIKNPNTNEIIDPKKSSTSPAPSSKSPANISAAPTPPPHPQSQSDLSHARTESKSIKTDAEKRAEMKEQIARKREADKAEEQRQKDQEEVKLAQEKKDAEEKLRKDREDADIKQREAAAAQMQAEEAAKKNKAEAEEAEKAAAKAKVEEDEAAKKAREAQELEEEIAKMEAEAAEQDRLEAENERRYQEKKKAEKEEAARKEAESFKMADAEMKRAEREAEEAEEARLKEQEQSQGDDSQKQREQMFAALKKETSATPSEESPAAEETPVDSGAVTPAPEAPAALPPKGSTGSGKQKPAALKLETNKSVEPAQPSAALVSLRSARPLLSIGDINYPAPINSPNPALNVTAATGRFKYDRAFLMQFSHAFTEKPSENWTEKVRETVGDTAEPSSARGTPRTGVSSGGSMMSGRQASNNRAPMPQGPMGSFTGSRTLPSGTTSEQRFQAASRNGPAVARPTMQNPLASFVSRPGAGFPQPASSTKMDRNPSSTGANHPNSPRNASQRGGSQRGTRANAKREDPKDNKAMPLTAGVPLKPIETTSTGWKPRSVGVNATGMAGPAPGGDGLMAPDVVQRKVKSNLNKMTPNNFDKISGQILAIAGQSKDESDGRSLRQVIQLTFEKATDEAHWAEMYAQFCKRMLESMSPEIKDENILDKKGDVVVGGALFRKYLLTRCQVEFERGWKMNLPEKPEGETEEAAMLSDAYYVAAAAKRRGLGLVRFIGELYKLQMLTERIMHECVKKLVDYEGVPDEAEIESLTSLLRTIGEQLDNSEKGHAMMDAYFLRIRGMIELQDLPSRLKFMLMDIVDLRHKSNWHSKGGAIKGPTTLDAVRQQAVEAERQKEVQRMQDNARRSGGGGGGRPPVGRGDARNFSGGGQYGMMPPPDYQRNTVGMDDLRRLGSRAGSRQPSTQGPATFGPTSMFSSARGSNTRKPLGIVQKDDSGASSRVSTPPAQKDKKEKDEGAKSGANAFSALASLESTEPADGASPATSPPTTKAQPVARQPVDRQHSKSPLGEDSAGGGTSNKTAESS